MNIHINFRVLSNVYSNSCKRDSNFVSVHRFREFYTFARYYTYIVFSRVCLRNVLAFLEHKIANTLPGIPKRGFFHTSLPSRNFRRVYPRKNIERDVAPSPMRKASGYMYIRRTKTPARSSSRELIQYLPDQTIEYSLLAIHSECDVMPVVALPRRRICIQRVF